MLPVQAPLRRAHKLHHRQYVAQHRDIPVPLSQVSINDSGVDYSQAGVYEVYYYYTGISGEVATVILTVVVE